MPNWPISAANLLLDGATVTILVFPLAASMWLHRIANRSATTRERTNWVGYTRRVSPLMMLVVPAWWSLSLLIRNSSNNLGFATDVPLWVLLVIPPSLSMLIARLVSYRADASVFGKRWTGRNIFQLAFWRTASYRKVYSGRREADLVMSSVKNRSRLRVFKNGQTCTVFELVLP